MNVKSADLAALSIDELSRLHEGVMFALARKLEEEKRKLEQRLSSLSTSRSTIKTTFNGKVRVPKRARRPYPPVRPKFRNPENPSETWAGRGKQPRWLVAQLKAGKKADDFRIGSKARTRAARRA